MNDEESLPLRWRGQVSGPLPLERILRMLDEHEIGTWHEVQYQGRWLTLEEFLQLREQKRAARALPPVPRREPVGSAQPLTPGSAPAQATGSAPGTVTPAVGAPARFRPKRFPVFAALGLALGFVGAHNLYAGYWGTAIAQLLLTAATWWLGFGFIATWLWALLELLLVHTDRRGVRLE
jgi:hypothetical protein